MRVLKTLPQPRLPLPPCRAAAEAPAFSFAAPRPAFDIRPSQVREELERAAWLRADAYYENRSVGRFKASFIKQFAGQELYSLLRRTKGPQPECITLIASSSSSSSSSGGNSSSSTQQQQQQGAGAGSCVGTLDVRPLDESATFGSVWPEGVPPLSTQRAAGLAAAYVSNVVVADRQRRQGLGRQLVVAAVQLAREQWRADHVYCHVEVDNEAALALYLRSGFSQLGDTLPPADTGLGRRLLLCCQLSDGSER